MNQSGKTKATRTTRYLMGTVPSQGFDGSEVVPAVSSPADQTFVYRLQFQVTPKSEYDFTDLCHTIDNDSDALFFCDTNLFHNSTDACLWDVLLAKEGRMVIIPQVLQELKPWLTTNSDHVAAQAVLRKDSNIHFLNFADSSEQDKNTFAYYVNLLSFRKKLVHWKLLEFKNNHGRAPDEQELASLKRKIHTDYGPRAYLLANKGADAPTSPNFFTATSPRM